MKVRALILPLVAAAALASSADAMRVNKTLEGVAIRGYDTVVYFTEGKFARGSEEFTHEWEGAVWQFASEANRDAFAESPEKYAPQYGGFCAWAMSQGFFTDADPRAWEIIETVKEPETPDGEKTVECKLYFAVNERQLWKWQKNRYTLNSWADEKWQKLGSGEPQNGEAAENRDESTPPGDH